MCGRYYVEIDEDELREIGEEAERLANAFPEPIPLKTRGEMFPTDVVPVQTARDRYVPMKWGFVTYDKKTIINARSETALQKPMFRRSMLENRCIIPASGYYEWKRGGFIHSSLDEIKGIGVQVNIDGIGDGREDIKRIDEIGSDGESDDKSRIDWVGAGGESGGVSMIDGIGGVEKQEKLDVKDTIGDKKTIAAKRGGVKKTKFRFYVPGMPIYMAGCYRQEKGSPLRTFVILTRDAVNGLEEFHDRMPVIIPRERVESWLYEGPGAIDDAILNLAYQEAV